MNKAQGNHLLTRLSEYVQSRSYPFHMPGHKRQEIPDGLEGKFGNGYEIDITEIDGFDNLHHPDGILKDAMEMAAESYGAKRSFFLVNGSTCGILAAVCGTTEFGGTILMARNCHKSVYHGVILQRLSVKYLWPEFIGEKWESCGIFGGVTSEMVREALLEGQAEGKKISAVLVVSPTYEGVVSDIAKIAETVHEFGIPLIVDEAHGAHFSFGKECLAVPESAVGLGADLVIQSLHKTLPSFTQTAILHVCGELADVGKVEQYLGMFQSSSPSYLLMAGIDRCIRYMCESGLREMRRYEQRMKQFYEAVRECRALLILDRGIIGNYGVADWDFSKIVIGTGRIPGLTGERLGKILRERYQLEMELCAAEYVIGMTSLMDREDGLRRLLQAILELDLEFSEKIRAVGEKSQKTAYERFPMPVKKCSIGEAFGAPGRRVALFESFGLVSKEFLYLYPPGIPIITPGEMISEDILSLICGYLKAGLSVQGISDHSVSTILTVAPEE